MQGIVKTLKSYIRSVACSPPTASVEESQEQQEVASNIDSYVKPPIESAVNTRKKNTNLDECFASFKSKILKEASSNIAESDVEAIENEFLNEIEPYCAMVTLPGGEKILFRPIFPIDKYMMKDCMVYESHSILVIERGEISQRSLTLRFNSVVTKVLDSSLDYLCNVNFDNHFSIGVMMEENGIWRGIGSGRFIQDISNPNEAEWSAIVVDAKHGHKMANRFGISKLMAVVHPENYCVLHWMDKLKAFREFKNECYFYVFNTPIPESWIANESNRHVLEKAANENGVLCDELRKVVLDNIRELAAYYKYRHFHIGAIPSGYSMIGSPTCRSPEGIPIPYINRYFFYFTLFIADLKS